jgi:hypothetical protein
MHTHTHIYHQVGRRTRPHIHTHTYTHTQAAFPGNLTPEQRMTDELAMLGTLAKTPTANIIKYRVRVRTV